MRRKEVVDALYRLAHEDDSFFVVEADDLTLQRDRLHFDAKGAQTLGQRYFDTLRREKII